MLNLLMETLGITRFKLFKPDVRGNLDDVIILTKILRELNYLAQDQLKYKLE